MRARWSRAAGALAACALVSAAAGCRKGSDELFDPVPKRAAPESPAPVEKVWTQDPEPFDENAPATPRIQMMWKPPTHERDELWSVKLDGTDIRPVVTPELLYGGEAKYVNRGPLRSPDGRWIAFSGETDGEATVRVLVDRKTRTVKTIKRSEGGIPEFNWTPDGKGLIFYDGGELWEYAVESGAMNKLPLVRSKRLKLLEGGKQFLAVRKDALEWYGRDGKLVKRRPLPFDNGAAQAVSPAGRYVAFRAQLPSGEIGLLVLEADQPKRTVYAVPSNYFFVTFGPDDDTLLVYRDEHLWKHALSSGNEVDLGHFPGGPLTELTFVPR